MKPMQKKEKAKGLTGTVSGEASFCFSQTGTRS